MAVTHTHKGVVGNHLTNDGKEFGDDVHSDDAEHTHEDVWMIRNPRTDQDELWAANPNLVTDEEADEIDAALSEVPDEVPKTSDKPVNASPTSAASATAASVK